MFVPSFFPSSSLDELVLVCWVFVAARFVESRGNYIPIGRVSQSTPSKGRVYLTHHDDRSPTMPTTGPEEPHQNVETSLENLFDDDDDADMMLIDDNNEADRQTNAMTFLSMLLFIC